MALCCRTLAYTPLSRQADGIDNLPTLTNLKSTMSIVTGFAAAPFALENLSPTAI
jgi:hypothetical protein